MALRTPLHDRHLAAGARMVDFAGYSMPLHYSGIRNEHLAVRTAAGMFDVSHMGEVLVRGPGAAGWVQRLVTNDLSRLPRGHALYTLMCNPQGGIIDDLIVIRNQADDHYLLVVNAATRAKDVAWLTAHLEQDGGVMVRDVSDSLALIAVQGPRALDILGPISVLDSGATLAQLRPFDSAGARIAGISEAHVQQVSRTGYTGEDGFELMISADSAGQLWDALLEAGAPHGLVPAGLGARDTLRLEAGLRLYGQDMDEHTDPYSCGLGWTVKLDAGDFIGASALDALRAAPPRRFVGLRLDRRHIARHGHRVRQGGADVGVVTSGTIGFSVGAAVATASVVPGFSGDEPVTVDIRGVDAPAEVVPLPFYRRSTGE